MHIAEAMKRCANIVKRQARALKKTDPKRAQRMLADAEAVRAFAEDDYDYIGCYSEDAGYKNPQR